METFCQILLVLWLAFGYLGCVHSDFHGKVASKPQGFQGFIVTTVILFILMFIYTKAGAFDKLF